MCSTRLDFDLIKNYCANKQLIVIDEARNSIINSFNTLNNRNDVGQLWENFLFVERLKKKSYKKILSNDFFRRTYAQNEIDLIEERKGKLLGFEFKYTAKKYKAPAEWTKNYPGEKVVLISKENFWDFVV